MIDRVLLGGGAGEVGLVGGPRRVGRGAIIGDGPGKRRLLLGVELLELAALVLPVASLAFWMRRSRPSAMPNAKPAMPWTLRRRRRLTTPLPTTLRSRRRRGSPRP